MGASHGKTKKEQKEEARAWANTKDIEVATLCGENTQLRNQLMMMQVDMQAIRDVLKGQQLALNESANQMNERMTEMENDVKVVLFQDSGVGGSLMPVSLGTEQEQQVYYRKIISDPEDPDAWKKETKRRNAREDIAWVGRVCSLKQVEKLYVDECKYKKTNMSAQRNLRVKSNGGHVYVSGLIDRQWVFPSTHMRRYLYEYDRVEPE